MINEKEEYIMSERLARIEENLVTLVNEFKNFRDNGHPACLVRESRIASLEKQTMKLESKFEHINNNDIVQKRDIEVLVKNINDIGNIVSATKKDIITYRKNILASVFSVATVVLGALATVIFTKII